MPGTQLSGVQLFGAGAREWGDPKMLDRARPFMGASFIHPSTDSFRQPVFTEHFLSGLIIRAGAPNKAWAKNGENQ